MKMCLAMAGDLCILSPLPARVAKLVDALASGASGSNPLEVQVLSRAPFFGAMPPAAFHSSAHHAGLFLRDATRQAFHSPAQPPTQPATAPRPGRGR